MPSMTWAPDSHEGFCDGAGSRELPWALVDEFSSSMPASYRVLFDPRTIRQHGSIVSRRGVQTAHAEVWRVLPDRSAAICVVAEDRPGLLSAIAAALVSHRLDVITALVFSRAHPAGDPVEAVDLLWVRRANPSDHARIDNDEATSIVAILTAILEGRISVEDIASCAVHDAVNPKAPTSVRFDEVDEDGRAVLIVEAPDRNGMLLTIALHVFQQGAQIVHSLVRTVGQRAYNRFQLVDLNGQALPSERRTQICSAVQAALALGPSECPLE